MATVLIAVASGLSAVVLLLLVVGLRRRVGDLTAEVARLRSSASAPHLHPAETATSQPAEQRSPAGSGRAEPGREEPVAVITALRTTPPKDEPGLGRAVSVTVAGPMLKAVALAHGVRRALDDEGRMRVGHAFRKELRRQRRLQRQVRPGARRGPGARP